MEGRRLVAREEGEEGECEVWMGGRGGWIVDCLIVRLMERLTSFWEWFGG